MNTNYAKYLILLLLIISGAVIISALFLFRKRRNRLQKSQEKYGKPDRPVKSGNISVFFDKQGNATIIPYVADLFGSGKATSDVAVLCQPYKEAKLGAAIRSSLASCHDGKPTGSMQLMEKLLSHDWKSFTEGKMNLSIYYKEDTGIVFNTTVRAADGAYVFIKKGAEFCLSADADDEAIGVKTLELLKRCRC